MKAVGSIGKVWGLMLALVSLGVLAGCNWGDSGSGTPAQGTASGSATSEASIPQVNTGTSLGSTPSAAATTATLSWIPPTTKIDGTALSNLAGYHIFYGTDKNNLDQVIDVSNPGVTIYVIQDLTVGTWYFAVSAYTADGDQSALSNIAAKTIT